MIYIGAENIVSPLGDTIDDNIGAISRGVSGIRPFKERGYRKEDVFLAAIEGTGPEDRFFRILQRSLRQSLSEVSDSLLSSPRTRLIISSTKGDLDFDINHPFRSLVQRLTAHYSLSKAPLIVSNACISGVLAISMGHDLIRSGVCDQVVVVGIDLLSDFVVYGFGSLFAISDQPTAPFDRSRKGVTLGEAAGTVVLSNNSTIFRNKPLVMRGGASANDANHISGPSRTGEGLVRSVARALAFSGFAADRIDFISAHGTGTVYNDEMESIAFERLGIAHVPVNSLKGYFGHTLGAAGVIETAVCLQSLRNQSLYRSLGYREQGTSVELNPVLETRSAQLTTVLKTASGFGGCNAAILLSL